MNPTTLYQAPNALAKHYARFRVQESVRLTGHSHQAWPDCARDGHIAAWDDAAALGDAKWPRAFAKADEVRRGFAKLTNDSTGVYALGENTHSLLVRWLSALPLKKGARIVTTDGEFHSVRRQLQRLTEEGLAVTWAPSIPAIETVDKLIAAINHDTAAVIVSSVFYQTGHQLPYIEKLAEHCAKNEVPLLVDVYHHLNVVPFDINELKLTQAYLVGGGYKYCQLGEGNCFLRTPENCALRPILTGWYAEFDHLALNQNDTPVHYANGPSRFASATYDPTAHYRAAAVFAFFEENKITPKLLHEVNQHQLHVIAEAFENLNADPNLIVRDQSVALRDQGGFLTFVSPRAADITHALAQRNIHVDYRGNRLRLGPAPYLSDDQLFHALDSLRDVLSKI